MYFNASTRVISQAFPLYPLSTRRGSQVGDDKAYVHVEGWRNARWGAARWARLQVFWGSIHTIICSLTACVCFDFTTTEHTLHIYHTHNIYLNFLLSLVYVLPFLTATQFVFPSLFLIDQFLSILLLLCLYSYTGGMRPASYPIFILYLVGPYMYFYHHLCIFWILNGPKYL